MDHSTKSLGIDRLSLAERVLLVEEKWDSIAAESESLEVPQSHKYELDRRIVGYNSNPHFGSTWEEVKSRLQRY